MAGSFTTHYQSVVKKMVGEDINHGGKVGNPF